MAAVPHFHLPIGAAPSLRGIERGIAALPAAARAEIAWAVPSVRAALREFLDSSRDRAALTHLTRTVLDALVGLVHVAPSGWNGPLLDHLDADVETEVASIRRHTDGATADAVEWAMRTWLDASRALPEFFRRQGVASQRGEIDETIRAAIAESDVLPIRLEALLVAVMEAANSETHRAAAPALADDAYELAQRLSAAWRQVGVEIDPWRGESRAARGARAVRYLRQLQGVMSDEDIQVIEASRMRDLR